MDINQNLIDSVIDQIVRDLEIGDTTALVELLSFLPAEKLQGYLPEVA